MFWSRKLSQREVSDSELIQVLEKINELSIVSKSANNMTYDFERSDQYLKDVCLYKNIRFPKRDHQLYPINSERHLYDISNIVISNLTITLKSDLHFKFQDNRSPLSGAKWHFEKCQFISESPNMRALLFPWIGTFRFFHNTFSFPESGGMRAWIFNFKDFSRVLFQENNFSECTIQLGQSISESDSSVEKISWDGRESYLVKDDTYYEYMIRKEHQIPDKIPLIIPHAQTRHLGLNNVSFLGNKKISTLNLICISETLIFRGGNEVNSLSIEEKFFELPNSRLYFGFRENIDPNFHFANHHRTIFLKMRDMASRRQDAFLESVAERQLDRIEYYFAKEQRFAIRKYPRQWIGILQDRARYAWRRWSSDFYRSWLRPLVMLVLGYVLLNAVPFSYLDSFSISAWVAFSFRPISRLAFYSQELELMFPSDYAQLSTTAQNVLRIVGYSQVTWIALWGFALGKSIKR